MTLQLSFAERHVDFYVLMQLLLSFFNILKYDDSDNVTIKKQLVVGIGS